MLVLRSALCILSVQLLSFRSVRIFLLAPVLITISEGDLSETHIGAQLTNVEYSHEPSEYLLLEIGTWGTSHRTLIHSSVSSCKTLLQVLPYSSIFVRCCALLWSVPLCCHPRSNDWRGVGRCWSTISTRSHGRGCRSSLTSLVPLQLSRLSLLYTV